MSYMQLSSGQIIETDTPHYWPEATRLSAKEGSRLMIEQTRATLLGILKPNDTVYCVLRHVSASGMSRRISFFAIQDGAPRLLDGYILDLGLGDRPRGNKDGVSVGGCGMDMGFHIVYNLGRIMWPNGTPEPHGKRNDEPDTDGGYALKSSWL